MTQITNPLNELKAKMEEHQAAFEQAKKAFEEARRNMEEAAEENRENLAKVLRETKMNDQQLARVKKMNDLKEQGIDPFGHAYDAADNSQGIKDAYGEKSREELEELSVPVSFAGRIMAMIYTSYSRLPISAISLASKGLSSRRRLASCRLKRMNTRTSARLCDPCPKNSMA